ncbi:hypothetical protein [Helicobacter ganmani]|uniref:hypothetical protein n=1 Tax=Helicobacter ganmani TaxID=60246 RepID=UPI003A876E31
MQGFVAKKQEDLANEKECNKSEKQKSEAICTIRIGIIKYHLSKFCKTNASALALIFKALMRGETIYSKVQFLQDCSNGSLLCQRSKDSDALENKENTHQETAQKESQSVRMYHKQESPLVQTLNVESPSLKKPIKTASHSESISPKTAQKDSKDSTQSQAQNSPQTFPLNIEG